MWINTQICSACILKSENVDSDSRFSQAATKLTEGLYLWLNLLFYFQNFLRLLSAHSLNMTQGQIRAFPNPGRSLDLNQNQNHLQVARKKGNINNPFPLSYLTFCQNSEFRKNIENIKGKIKNNLCSLTLGKENKKVTKSLKPSGQSHNRNLKRIVHFLYSC